MNKKIVLASTNQGKINEINALFLQKKLDITCVSQCQFDIAPAIENAPSFVQNALIKAYHAAKHANLPALADDSGLCVPALLGAPGIYSSRFSSEGSDTANNAKLLQKMQDISNRTAYFVCTLAFVRHATDPDPIIAQGKWHGQILTQAMGTQGFGYDPLFFVPSLQKSAAQLSKNEKNAISHRGCALQKLIDALIEQKYD